MTLYKKYWDYVTINFGCQLLLKQWNKPCPLSMTGALGKGWWSSGTADPWGWAFMASNGPPPPDSLFSLIGPGYVPWIGCFSMHAIVTVGISWRGTPLSRGGGTRLNQSTILLKEATLGIPNQPKFPCLFYGVLFQGLIRLWGLLCNQCISPLMDL